jgi:hypothetical protein
VLWNGPGCSYKHLEAPNLEALQKHFLKVQNNPIRPIKDFLEGITLVSPTPFSWKPSEWRCA